MRVVPKQQQSPPLEAPSFTEIQVDDLFFCLEERKVLVRGQEILLSAKEFNAFQLLITSRRQVMTFEMITDHIWGYDYDSVENMLGAIHNIMSRHCGIAGGHSNSLPQHCQKYQTPKRCCLNPL